MLVTGADGFIGSWLAERLLAEGSTVRIYDPVALANVKEWLPGVACIEDPLEACLDAHAAVVCTEWPQIADLAGSDLVSVLAYPIVIDGRNALDPEDMRSAGIRYHGLGRPPIVP